MTTRADFMDSVDLIKNRIIELTQERDQLRQRVADLEAQLAEAKDGGWTYTADDMPEGNQKLLLTIFYPKHEWVEVHEGYLRNDSFVGVGNAPYGGAFEYMEQKHGTEVIAWKPLPQPAPLRTAASEQEPTP